MGVSPACMYIIYVSVPTEVKGGHWVPCNWSYG